VASTFPDGIRGCAASALLLVALACAADGHAIDSPRVDEQLVCRGATHSVTWHRLAPEEQRATLDRWCSSVGPPATRPARSTSAPITALVIASWNVHVGGGDVERLLEWIRARPALAGKTYGVVLLLQEAFRAGPEVPAPPEGMDMPKAIRRRGAVKGVVELAETLDLHAAYVPSMRDGSLTAADARDRGNAILSTEPLSDVRAIELPLGRQRRVAVGATIMPSGGPALRVITLHLDTRGRRVEQARALTAYLADTAVDGAPTIVGGDLNTLLGRRDRAYKIIDAVMPEQRCGSNRTNEWPRWLDLTLGWWRGRVDFIFDNLSGAALVPSCETVPQFLGSDHLPVVMIIQPL
jgi:endonuclease/exonuclease/phosphatase family metal-dependent hydrolase